MKLFVKIIAGTVVFVVVVTVISLLPIWDDTAITDSDLLLPAPTMPKVEQNGYTYLNKAVPLTSAEQDLASRASALLGGDDIKTNQATALAEAKAIADGSKRIMPLFLQAAQQKTFVCPTETCPLNTYAQIYDIAVVNAYYVSRQGDVAKASELFTALLQFGVAFATQETKNAELITYLVGQKMLNRTIAVASLPGVHTLGNMSMFKNYVLPENTFTQVRKRMYMDDKVLVLKGLENSVGQSYWLLPNRTINNLAEFAREEIAIAGDSCSKNIDTTQADALTQKIVAMRELTFSKLFSPNMKGDIILSVTLASNIHTTRAKMCEYNAQVMQLSTK